MDTDTRVYLEEAIATQVAGGYDDADEIIESFVERVEDDEELDATEDDVIALVTQAWTARIAEQQHWPAVTDVDKLERAFELLEASGVLARDNFTCCQNCGHSEIGDARADTSYDGYTFFHLQDTERAASGSSLFLAYGSFSEDTGAEAIGRRVIDAIQAQGLTVEWDGTADTRISVKLDWKKRLPV